MSCHSPEQNINQQTILYSGFIEAIFFHPLSFRLSRSFMSFSIYTLSKFSMYVFFLSSLSTCLFTFSFFLRSSSKAPKTSEKFPRGRNSPCVRKTERFSLLFYRRFGWFWNPSCVFFPFLDGKFLISHHP